MKNPPKRVFCILFRTAGGFSEHPEKHQQQDDSDGNTE